jgi:arsenate reductase (thioredoxin)
MQIVLTLALTLVLQTSTSNPAVVFVCEHGAAKSVVATAYFNKLAAERGLPFRATFRGTDPQAELSQSTLKGLRDDEIEIPTGKPAVISQEDVAQATHVFAIGCTLPAMAKNSGKASDWSDVPEGQGYAPMRDAIVRHVKQLLDELQR